MHVCVFIWLHAVCSFVCVCVYVWGIFQRYSFAFNITLLWFNLRLVKVVCIDLFLFTSVRHIKNHSDNLSAVVNCRHAFTFNRHSCKHKISASSAKVTISTSGSVGISAVYMKCSNGPNTLPFENLYFYWIYLWFFITPYLTKNIIRLSYNSKMLNNWGGNWHCISYRKPSCQIL